MKAMINKFFFLDFGHREVYGTGRVIEAFLAAHAQGMTMLGVFHDLDLIERIADRVVVMGNGRVEATGRIGEVSIPKFDLQQEFAPRV